MTLTDYEIILLAVGIVGIYIKLHTEIVTVKSRIYTLENGNKKIEQVLNQLSADLAEIKLLLARNRMD